MCRATPPLICSGIWQPETNEVERSCYGPTMRDSLHMDALSCEANADFGHVPPAVNPK
jgi:hypothetical protein